MSDIMSLQQPKSWKPDRPVSRGATEFHDAVINATWNHECLDYLISLAEPNIRENDIVVDFGAGTGTSAARILEKIKTKIRLWLVDNSPAWLGKAYEIFRKTPNVSFFVLEKKNGDNATLSETVGKEAVDNVLSANTVHLIPDLKSAFKGIAEALKPKGIFIFNSTNVTREGRPDGALMLDSTVYRVHDIAIDIIKSDPKYKKYRKGIDNKIVEEAAQRNFIFPQPKPINDYLKALKDAGFESIRTNYKCIRVKYNEYIKFLRVKRLQAGMLPEVGGKKPSPEEEKDRDELVTMASLKLFKELEENNPLADSEAWQCEWAYVSAVKLG